MIMMMMMMMIMLMMMIIMTTTTTMIIIIIVIFIVTGLDVVRSQILANLGDRSNLTNIVIVVTDGHSGDNVRAPSSRLRDMNVTIISVGVGCCYDIFNLKDMSSDPDEDYVFEASFTTLDTIVGRMRQRICSGK